MHTSKEIADRFEARRPQFSDRDIDWMSERVRFYIRRGSFAAYAIEHAVDDFRKLNA